MEPVSIYVGQTLTTLYIFLPFTKKNVASSYMHIARNSGVVFDGFVLFDYHKVLLPKGFRLIIDEGVWV